MLHLSDATFKNCTVPTYVFLDFKRKFLPQRVGLSMIDLCTIHIARAYIQSRVSWRRTNVSLKYSCGSHAHIYSLQKKIFKENFNNFSISITIVKLKVSRIKYRYCRLTQFVFRIVEYYKWQSRAGLKRCNVHNNFHRNCSTGLSR